MSSVDVLVVGAGPAGLATAIAARRHGLAVRVLERRRSPLDKACGEGLMPDAVAALGRLGVETRRLGRPFAGVRWYSEGAVADGRFPGPPGVGVRRTVLADALLAAARREGVDVAFGERVEGLAGEGAVRASRGVERAAWVVAADGLRSPLARQAGLARPPARHRRFGVRRHLRTAPWCDAVEVWWGERAEAYVTPVAEDEVGVAMLWSGRAAGFDELLGGFPDLAERLAGAVSASRDRGAGPFRQRVRGVVDGRLALVGDAAGYVDAVTGEGVGLAVQEGEALAAALAAGDPARYRAASRRLRRLPETLTRLLLVAERHPRLRRRLVAALAADGGLFGRLLAVHARQLPAAGFGAAGWCRLALGMARA